MFYENIFKLEGDIMEKEEIISIISYRVDHHRIVPYFFDSLYEDAKDSATVTEAIKEQFESILASCFSCNFSSILEELSCYDDMYSYIINHIPTILKYFHGDFLSLSSFPIQEHVNNHFSELISSIPKDSFFTMAISEDYVKGENKKILNQFLENHKKDYVFFLLGKMLSLSYSMEQLDTLTDVLVLIVDELLEHEELSYGDIRMLTDGAYSDCVEIGSKVLKVGDERYTYFMKNNPFIVSPLIRVDLNELSFLRGTVEVIEKVDTDINITDDELYEIYKQFRLLGLIWLDVKVENVGRLLKDNIIHYKKALYPDPITRGLFGDENEIVLKKGDYVVCDLDHIVFEDVFQQDSKLQQDFYLSNAYYYEERYQKSKIKNG